MLTALTLTLAGLVLLALAGLALPKGTASSRLVHGGALLGAVVMAGCGTAGLLGGRLSVVAVGGFGIALDGLSAWFLLLLGLATACSSLFALAHETATPRRLLAAYPLFIAAMALTLLAADGVTLMLGFAGMSLASWVLVATDHAEAENRRAARLYLVFAAFGAICLGGAFGLLSPAGDPSFAAIRAAPPTGWPAAAILALVMLGAGAKAGLVPLHVWLPLAHPAAPSHVSALMSAAMTKVALYVLARLLLDLCGPAQPLWWGVPLLMAGAASAVLGALRASLEEEGKTLLACSTIEHVGLIAIGLGLAACFRAADLGSLAALAAGAALLHALAHALFKSLLFLGMGEVLHAAGSRRLDRLGGLVHAMPVTTAAVLVGALAAASLPPLSGFAGTWMLLQALLAAWRIGDLAFQLLVLAAVAAAALSAGLAAAAMVRLFGLAFLGRPRTPRAAGAVDGPPLARLALLLPAALTVLLGVLPGPMLALAEPALRSLTGHGVAERAGLGALRLGDGAAAYLPLALVCLLAAFAGLLVWAVRRRSPAAAARGKIWTGGFAAGPAHRVFGDPLTQPSAAGFAQPLRRIFGPSLLAAQEATVTPPPGDPSAAHVNAGFADRSDALLLAPLARLREAVVRQAERLRHLSLRRALMLPFATLVALLALAAGWGTR